MKCIDDFYHNAKQYLQYIKTAQTHEHLTKQIKLAKVVKFAFCIQEIPTFLQSFKENARITFYMSIGPLPLPFTVFLIHHSQLSNHSELYRLSHKQCH